MQREKPQNRSHQITPFMHGYFSKNDRSSLGLPVGSVGRLDPLSHPRYELYLAKFVPRIASVKEDCTGTPLEILIDRVRALKINRLPKVIYKVDRSGDASRTSALPESEY